MTALVDTVVAETPIAFITVIAFPIACIGIRGAGIAEDAGFQALPGIIFTHEHIRWACRLSERRQWSAIAVSDEDMGMLVVGRIASGRCLLLIAWPSRPSKSKPVFTSLSEAIAANTDVVCAVIAPRAVVVKLVLYVLFATVFARYIRLSVQVRHAWWSNQRLPWLGLDATRIRSRPSKWWRSH